MTRFVIFAFVLTGCVGTIEDLGGPEGDLEGDPADPTDPTPDPTEPPPAPDAITYSANIAPKLTFCAGCHAKTNPDGGYRTDSYAGLLGTGKDPVPNLIAGDAQSLLVQYLAPAPGKNHKDANTAVPGIGDLVRDWVVSSNAAQ